MIRRIVILLVVVAVAIISTRHHPGKDHESGADYYQFDVSKIPALESFELISSELDVSRGTASRRLELQNADGHIFIELFRVMPGVSCQDVYRMGPTRSARVEATPVDIGDEAVQYGDTLVFRCGDYVCYMKDRSGLSRIAAGNMGEFKALTPADFEALDLMLRDLGSEIAAAIRDQSQELEPLEITEVKPGKAVLGSGSVEASSTWIDMSLANHAEGDVAVFAKADGLNIRYVGDQIGVGHRIGVGRGYGAGWQTVHITAVNDALQVATGSCRLFVEQARQDAWAAEVYEKGLKGLDAKAFFEAKLREHQKVEAE